MGFFGWVRGLFGGRGSALPCDFCSAAIPPEEFREGRAVTIARLHYCPRCVARVMKSPRNEGGHLRLTSSTSSAAL
jgi:hypothetical protein